MMNILLSDGFFKTLANLIKVRYMLKDSQSRKFPVFKDAIKKRALLLNQFSFNKTPNVNFERSLRFQFVVENLLQYVIDERVLQNYVKNLMLSHELMTTSIITDPANLRMIVKGILGGNYVYFEFMTEILEISKFKHKSYSLIQKMLISAGFLECLIYLIGKFRFCRIEGTILLSIEDAYFKLPSNIIQLLEIILVFLNIKYSPRFGKDQSIDNNYLHLFVTFLMSVSLQNSIPNLHYAANHALTNLVRNISELSRDHSSLKAFFGSIFVEFYENLSILKNERIFDFFTIFVTLNEKNLFLQLVHVTSLFSFAVASIDLDKCKRKSLKIILILRFALSVDSKVISSEVWDILQAKLSKCTKKHRNNMLFTELGNFSKIERFVSIEGSSSVHRLAFDYSPKRCVNDSNFNYIS